MSYFGIAQNDHQMTIKPNFFIVGAPKAGTTTLFSLLARHPEVFTPRYYKEPHYFSSSTITDDNRIAIRDEQTYLGLFSGAERYRAVGEASTSYLRDPEVPRLLREFNPEARIIVLLRDPVERAFSHYLMRRRLGRTRAPFSEVVSQALAHPEADQQQRVGLLASGYYASHIRAYQAYFQPDQILLLLFERFIRETEQTYREVCRFLEIDDTKGLPSGTVTAANPYGVPRNPLVTWLMGQDRLKSYLRRVLPFDFREWLLRRVLTKHAPKPQLDEETAELLRTAYRDEVQALSGLIAEPLPWRHFQGEAGH